MIYAIDTMIATVVIRGRNQALARRLLSYRVETIAIPEMVRAELYVGVAKSAQPMENRKQVDRFLGRYRLLPFEGDAVWRCAEIRAGLERAGQPIGANDLVIAATALAHGCVLVTDNVREFARVPGLAVENWLE